MCGGVLEALILIPASTAFAFVFSYFKKTKINEIVSQIAELAISLVQKYSIDIMPELANLERRYVNKF